MYIPKLCGELLDATSKFKDLDRLNYYAMIAICVYIVNAICDFFRTFLYHLLGEKIVVALRNDCYKKFISADIDFHDRIKSGELLSRLGSDISTAKSATSGNLGTLMRHILTSIGNLVILIYMSWKLSLTIFICLPIFIYSSSYCV
jgi:ABC-type multidrug transport system fused ATPase/permease subunit